jgi:hypothetical protein
MPPPEPARPAACPDTLAAEAMRRALALGWAGPGARWQLLSGGRTNLVWRVRPAPGPAGGDLAVKLYLPAAATPLFPNDGRAEYRVLRHLSGSGLAPEALDHAAWPGGEMLLYRHVEGAAGGAAPQVVAGLLGRLHRRAPPPGLRRLPSGSAALLRAGEAMLAECPPRAAARLHALRPRAEVAPQPRAVLLHGDPVAANVVGSGAAACLIDWQCPAAGEPCEDLAVALSPAMQRLYGAGPDGRLAAARLLAAYPDPAAVDRYRRLAAHFHWRMAAYCLWRASCRGDAAYAAALEDEIAALRVLAG